jgi:hypothetical protein
MKNSSDGPLNGLEGEAVGGSGIPEILCTRFVRKNGNRGILQFSGILSVSNLSVLSADVGFDSSPRLETITASVTLSCQRGMHSFRVLASSHPRSVADGLRAR